MQAACLCLIDTTSMTLAECCTRPVDACCSCCISLDPETDTKRCICICVRFPFGFRFRADIISYSSLSLSLCLSPTDCSRVAVRTRPTLPRFASDREAAILRVPAVRRRTHVRTGCVHDRAHVLEFRQRHGALHSNRGFQPMRARRGVGRCVCGLPSAHGSSPLLNHHFSGRCRDCALLGQFRIHTVSVSKSAARDGGTRFPLSTRYGRAVRALRGALAVTWIASASSESYNSISIPRCGAGVW